MDPLEQAPESKLQKCRTFLDTYVSYPKLLIPDGALAFIHILVLLCLRLQWLMIIPFILFRIPRLVLYLVTMKLGSSNQIWYSREFIFRKYSCILYFPVAIIFQMITMVTNFCMQAADTKACNTGYAITLTILLLLH